MEAPPLNLQGQRLRSAPAADGFDGMQIAPPRSCEKPVGARGCPAAPGLGPQEHPQKPEPVENEGVGLGRTP